ncbi:MAG: bacterial regulatory s, tetR family protein [Pseudomonas sp.]|uniref:TetR/AcrR family transcriptional regulator n=1 Tax=Pseudomonas sp. TaxID=306 RepID=UPI00261052EA|nr:TetR/AcrR family transcriptional regulator [Pseudomonas sp.]MDB6052088.1 bacterial regulatory s, tetR family protein [Pseudomonas sp.]
MGRPRKFSRESVLEKALPVFWQHGYAGTSVQDLEQATGVNKSGLYAEFKGKEDLFLESLRFYFQTRGGLDIMVSEPLGWGNIEAFIRLGEGHSSGQKGCFSVNSMREFSDLSADVHELVTGVRTQLLPLLVKNIEAEQPKMDPRAIAELVMVFFSGICIEQNLACCALATDARITSLMQVLCGL